MQAILLTIPNIPDKTVVIGKDENDNKEVKKWGIPRQFNFQHQAH